MNYTFDCTIILKKIKVQKCERQFHQKWQDSLKYTNNLVESPRKSRNSKTYLLIRENIQVM